MANNTKGFSLIETLMVLSIIAILLVFIIPSQKQLLQTKKSEILCAQLFHAIELARSEALINHENVILCPNKEWKNGFIVKASEHILYAYQTKNLEGEIIWRAFPNHRAELEFLPTGFTNVENGTFSYLINHKVIFSIAINQGGRGRCEWDVNKGLEPAE